MIDKTKYLIFILVLTLFSSCSFDNKTGIWDGSEKEKKRISDIEWNQKNIKKIVKVYSSTNIFKEEVIPEKNIILSEPKKISSWSMANYNHQNFLGNIYISGIDNVFLKKKSWKR